VAILFYPAELSLKKSKPDTGQNKQFAGVGFEITIPALPDLPCLVLIAEG
jgi:hypothetical protein